MGGRVFEEELLDRDGVVQGQVVELLLVLIFFLVEIVLIFLVVLIFDLVFVTVLVFLVLEVVFFLFVLFLFVEVVFVLLQIVLVVFLLILVDWGRENRGSEEGRSKARCRRGNVRRREEDRRNKEEFVGRSGLEKISEGRVRLVK